MHRYISMYKCYNSYSVLPLKKELPHHTRAKLVTIEIMNLLNIINEMSKHTVIKLYTSLIPVLNLDKFAKLICNVVKLKFATIKYIPGQGLGPVIDYREGWGGVVEIKIRC